MSEDSAAFDDILARLRQRIERRRADGTYPDDLEEQLAAHYERIVNARSSLGRDPASRLEERIDDVHRAGHFEPRQPPVESRWRAGRAAHRALTPFVVRHADELRRQMGEYATTVTRALREIREFELHVDVALRRLLELVAQNEHDVATVHFTELEVERRVAELAAHRDPTWFRPWFTNDAFEAVFRGGREEILDRYRDLADRLEGCGPVLEIGCGRGEILELLAERGVEARGVELDPELVRDASARGLDVSEGDGLTTLAGLPDAGVGGIVLIQVIEHLSPQQIADLIPLAARKLRDGGRLIVETVNPLSLYVFGHALYLDPTHLRLVHPFYLEFLAREAGFADVRTDWRSLPRAEERFSEIPADDPSAAAVNPVVRRLNQLLFGPQDYALIATR